MIEVTSETTLTINGVELEKRFLKELARLAFDWAQQKDDAPGAENDKGRKRGMGESVADVRDND